MVKKKKELGVTSFKMGCYTQFLILESCDYSSTAACAAANGIISTLRRIWETFGKHYEHVLHVLQILLAKAMISHDITFVLHVFLAERVCFFTISGKVTSFLSTIMFQSKEKQAD